MAVLPLAPDFRSAPNTPFSSAPVAQAFALRPVGSGAVDLIVDGVNLSARLGAVEALPLIRDLARVISELAAGHRARGSVGCLGADQAWELGVERSGGVALLSFFRGGNRPEVVAFERPLSAPALIGGLLDGIDQAERETRTSSAAAELREARGALVRCEWPGGPPSPHLDTVCVEPDPAAPLGFSAEIALRKERSEAGSSSDVERADLFGLLFRGTLGVSTTHRSRELGEGFVFLVAEQLVGICHDLVEAWEQGRAIHRRIDVSGIILSARLRSPKADANDDEASKPLWFTMGGPRTSGLRDAWTLGLDEVPALARAVIRFGRGITRAVLRARPSEARNLRLSAFRAALTELAGHLRDSEADDAKVNSAPEGYRAFAAALRARKAQSSVAPTPSRIRYSARWMATVADLDLGSTFLCGDRIIIGAARETACLDRSTGSVLWRIPTARAASVVTPQGLARMHADGAVAVHDFATGDITMTTRIAPRVGGPAAGAVVNVPGLPRLLIVTESKRHLSAIDLTSGEVRWRRAARRGDSFRLRRAGKLLIVAAGDPSLTALDVQSGEVVWRARDRLRFVAQVGLDHDSLFAFAGEPKMGARGLLRLYHLDPFAGTTRWVHDLPDGVVPAGPPLIADGTVIVPTRDVRGLGLYALSRSSGQLAWSLEPGLSPHRTEWFVVDDVLVRNSESGELAGIATQTGATVFRHLLPRGAEGDQPRRLEPVLRSGALFVPQADVHVVRPRDGALLGRIAGDVIPDLLRVDENCDVYLAEQSGHIAAYRAGARLSLV